LESGSIALAIITSSPLRTVGWVLAALFAVPLLRVAWLLMQPPCVLRADATGIIFGGGRWTWHEIADFRVVIVGNRTYVAAEPEVPEGRRLLLDPFLLPLQDDRICDELRRLLRHMRQGNRPASGAAAGQA
jgi:hypothetical protein